MALKIFIEDTELRKELRSEFVALVKSMARSESASTFEKEFDKSVKAYAKIMAESSWLHREFAERVFKEVVRILVQENRATLNKALEDITKDKEVFGNGVQEFIRREVQRQVKESLDGIREQALAAIEKTTSTLAVLSAVPK